MKKLIHKLGDPWVMFWTIIILLGTYSIVTLSCDSNGHEPVLLSAERFEYKNGGADTINPFPKQTTQSVENNLSILTVSVPSEIKKKIVGYKTQLVYRFTKKLYATTYSRHDSPVEAKGIYANQNFAAKLHRSERRINVKHFTVALPPGLKQYHTALFQLPSGKWTHKFRVHVPYYNNDNKTDIDTGYFSVPRDRMRQKGRIDVLHTGYEAIVKRKQRAWRKLKTHDLPIEFWELIRKPVYEGERKENEK